MTSNTVILGARQAIEWRNLDVRLGLVIDDVLKAWPSVRLVIGDIFRTEEEECAIERQTGKKPSGIHKTIPHRSIDVQSHNLADGVGERWAICQEVAEGINTLWIYDPSRPSMVVAYAGRHGTGPHLHLQTHPRTRKRSAINERSRA